MYIDLLISINEFFTSIIHLLISIIQLLISITNLLISVIQLMISINEFSNLIIYMCGARKDLLLA